MSYDSYVSSLSPVGWWKLNDSVGSSTAADSSGNGLTLTVTGTVTFGQTTPSPISSDTGALFDGSTGYLKGTMSTAIASALNGSFTVIAWAQNSNWNPTGDQHIASMGGASFVTNELFQMFIDGNNFSGGGLAIGFYGDDWGSGNKPASGWHFIAITVTRGSSTSVRQLFVDGTSVGSNTSTGNLTVASGEYVEIGREVASSNYWPGDIAQVAVFNSVLTSTQISNLYTGGPSSAPLRTRHPLSQAVNRAANWMKRESGLWSPESGLIPRVA